MTQPSAEPEELPSLIRRLPWWIALASLTFFCFTLNHWVSLSSLGNVSEVCGWNNQDLIQRPLVWLGFLPVRSLPAALAPLAMNFITAVVGALVLAQLARSVSILRLDIVSPDPMRIKVAKTSVFTGAGSWLPPVFAAALLMLQHGFWEHATTASGEMFGVLCFAFALRGVFEFRISANDRWLFRAALVFTAGMAENCWLLGYAPLFAAAIIWVKGYGQCLNLRFALRLALWTLIGFGFHLIGSALAAWQSPDQITFAQALSANLAAMKTSLRFLKSPELRFIVLTGVLPFLLLGARWRSHSVQFADDTPIGVFITRATGHVIHFLFLLAALWFALQPIFSPLQRAVRPPLLVHAYPWALVAGYCAAYLLVFGLPRDGRKPAHWPRIVANILLVSWPLLLLCRNWSDIRWTNSSALREFANQIREDLPDGNSTVLANEPYVGLLRAEFATHTGKKTPLFVDATLLPLARYQDGLARANPGRWVQTSTNTATLGEVVSALKQIAAREPLLALQNGPGLLYEVFTPEPAGWAQRLTSRENSSRSPAAMGAVTEVWGKRWASRLDSRAAEIPALRRQREFWNGSLFKTLKLEVVPGETEELLGVLYSKAANERGALLSRIGRVTDACEWFERALVLSPYNFSAQVNLEFNSRRARGDTNRISPDWLRETFVDAKRKTDAWKEIITRDGPVDEPTSLLQSGVMHVASGQPRQALECFARADALDPGWAATKLWQAQSRQMLGQFAAVETLTAELIATDAAETFRGPALARWLQLRTSALCKLARTNDAVEFASTFVQQHQAHTEVIAAASDALSVMRQTEAELRWRETFVQREPKRADGFVKLGHAEMRAQRYDSAIRTLTTALELQPTNHQAQLFRAISSLYAGRLDDAQRDFEIAQKNPATEQKAMFALGALAWQRKDTNAMIQYYQSYLSNSTPDSAQSAIASRRLKAWQDE